VSVAAGDRVGTELAGYRIEEVLGRGGMSVVYRADDLRLKRKVALKLLAPELAEDEFFRERFLRESQLAASLDHPNVVPVYEAGEAEQMLYIAMRYVPGTNLKTRLRKEGRLEGDRALALVGQVGSALDAAHERGLVHRDVKPSNVLLTGRPGKEHCYLADFGLSTSASDRSLAAERTQVVGTIDYVAPEQIRGAEVDGRVDVYSLACLLYECLTGDVPFRRASDVAVVYAHLEEPAPSANERVPALPTDLDAVIRRGMAKTPDERWPTCGALVEAAGAALGGRVVPLPARPRTRRRRATAAAAAVVASAAAAALAWLVSGGGTAVARADSLVRIDPAGGKGVAGLAVGGRPSAVTVCGGSVWVTIRTGAVFEIDPTSLREHTVRVAGTPTDVADDGDLAAVVSGPPETVTMIDAGFGRVSDVVAVPRGGAPATAVAFGRDIWIANPSARRLDLLDPPYTATSGAVRLPAPARLVAAGDGALWAAGGRTVWRIDPGSRRVVRRYRLSFSSQAIAAGDGGVWLVDRAGDAVARLDPSSGRIVARLRVGRSPAAVTLGAGAVWVANRVDGTVTEIDPRLGVVRRTVRIGGRPVDLVAGLGGVWVVRET
jgi:tRNA A-37 threonylcarbamoyl transferase component Bud32/streptogramin lyase